MAPFGATIIDAEGLRLNREEKALFRDVRPFGFILFARNIESPDQTRALCAEMREAAGHDAVITIDQEGGRVQRMRAPHWREWMAPRKLVERAGNDAERAMYLMYRIIADELRSCGVDSNCAPMVDVLRATTHTFLQDRCYATGADWVARLGRAAADGLLAGGVLPVVKHLPGHGLATIDSHFGLPHVKASRAELKTVDFFPFEALSDLPMGMTAHVVYEDFDDKPATLSQTMMGLIRTDIGFRNLIMTDDLSMKALSGTPASNARAALAAGCDIALFCNAPLAERAKVAAAAGEMSILGMARANRALAMRKAPDDVDISALESDLEALLGGALHG